MIKRLGNDYYLNTDTGEKIEPKFLDHTCYDDFVKSGAKFVIPMNAKESLDEDDQKERFTNDKYIEEEKYDGTRGTLHFFESYTRLFSRRTSTKTGWLCENSDLVPHIRDLSIPELEGTIIDGELFIDGQPFQIGSSVLNCNWKKALDRQIEFGLITFHAFDILYYKGVNVKNFPLWKRKAFLHNVITKIDSPYVKEVFFFDNTIDIDIMNPVVDSLIKTFMHTDCKGADLSLKKTYPTLFDEVWHSINRFSVTLSKEGYYEYLCYTGKEGVILKNNNGKYHEDKRKREYTKIKKFLDRDLVIMGFNEPTREYKGDHLEGWIYYEKGTPVTKYYHYNWVGTMRLGVVVNEEEFNTLSKLFRKKRLPICVQSHKDYTIFQIGECAGYDEETRKKFTAFKEEMVGQVAVIRCNGVSKDTLAMRHPRYYRMHDDKNFTSCTIKNHLGGA